jgi:hypothetical protein
MWINDAQHDPYAGLIALRDELKARFPELLIAGEGWYDALGAFSPLSHTPGHIPALWPETFTRSNRCFLHLSAGDPSRGSTGVHELGRSPFARAPDAPHMLPTLTVVDGTLALTPSSRSSRRRTRTRNAGCDRRPSSLSSGPFRCHLVREGSYLGRAEPCWRASSRITHTQIEAHASAG